MAQPSSLPPDLPTDVDHQVIHLPTWSEAQLLTGAAPAPTDRRAAHPTARARTHPLHQVVVLEFTGPLGVVVKDVDRAVQLSLADGPRGVVCDLSGVLKGAEQADLEVLATVGRHVRDWSGIPVALASPDPRTRKALRFHPLGSHLIVTQSVLQAVSAALAPPIPSVEWLRLAPHPTSPRASRNFVARTLLDWGLGRLIPSVSLVVSELVTSSTVHAGTDIDLSIAWNLGALRLTVRDNSPDPPRQRFSRFDQQGRGLSAIAGLSRSYGVLPTADGGKVVWAVLYAARPRPQTSRRSTESLTITKGRTMTDLCVEQ